MSIPFVLQHYVQKGLSHNLPLWPAFGSRDDEMEKRRSKAGMSRAGRAGLVLDTRPPSLRVIPGASWGSGTRGSAFKDSPEVFPRLDLWL